MRSVLTVRIPGLAAWGRCCQPEGRTTAVMLYRQELRFIPLMAGGIAHKASHSGQVTQEYKNLAHNNASSRDNHWHKRPLSEL
eukprot:34305-Amphidinium_carterae.2